ncbi:hypothetical protein EV714DRAFT_277763 [Schizophyllum commune]
MSNTASSYSLATATQLLASSSLSPSSSRANQVMRDLTPSIFPHHGWIARASPTCTYLATDKHLRGAATPSPPPPTSRTARHIIPLINPARTKHVSYTVPFNSALLVFDRKTWLRLLLSVCDTATAGCIPDGVHENGLSELKQDT